MDIFTMAKTKLDSSFPESQFLLPGMRKPFWLDVTSTKNRLLVFLSSNIPSKYQVSIQTIPFEINLKSTFTGLLDHYLKSYKDFLKMADLNENESNPKMRAFLNKCNCENIIKTKTCYRSQESFCIDLLSKSRRFY